MWMGQAGVPVLWGRLLPPWMGWASVPVDRARWYVEHQARGAGRRTLFAGAYLLAGSTQRMKPSSVPRLISQINPHLSTTQEEQGGSLLQALRKDMLFIGLGTKGHCFTLFSSECWGIQTWCGGGGKEGTRSEATPSSSKPLGQTWLQLVSHTNLCQQSRHEVLASPLLPGSLFHSPRYTQALEPCLRISLPRFSRSKTSSCLSGSALRHQVSSQGFFTTASLWFHVIPCS